jgi:hypothetical protein
LGELSAEQIAMRLSPSEWTIKDEIVHLWAWQQRSIARMEAALSGGEPEFPNWPVEADPESAEEPVQINAWIYQAYRERPWEAVYGDWHNGFLRFLKAAAEVSEMELLDSARYPWMNGYPLATVLLATYDHHQEHYEKLPQPLI